MQRCLQLAVLGEGHVAPNPLVGAVLCYQERIIGEGYHARFGGPHAELACILSVKETDRILIPLSTLYVSLEPCNHTGKTGPCSELIIQQGIKEVWVACTDPFEKVNGSGIARLREAGITVHTGLMEAAAKQINKRFFTFHLKQRPYIILKWAESSDGFMAAEQGRTKISHAATDRLVHQWRSQEAAIMVGTRTAILDNPKLTVRLWPGKNPVRVTLDREASLPRSLNLFNTEANSIIFTEKKIAATTSISWLQVPFNDQLIPSVLNRLWQEGLNSLLVEGGAHLLQAFIETGLWDEARIISNPDLFLKTGLAAPQIKNAILMRTEQLPEDKISYYSAFPNPILIEP